MRWVLVATLVWVALTVYSMLDVARTEPSRVRGVSRPWWALIIILLPLVGALLWLFAGRPRSQHRPPGPPRGTGGGPGPGGRGPTGGGHVRGPDDDSDFLRDLDRRLHDGRRGDSPPSDPPADGPGTETERR